MKADIHPKYRAVVFRDITADFQFITKSAIADSDVKDTVEIDGVTYPMIQVDISSASHPYYTGTQKVMDTEGRIDKYYRKYGFAAPPEPTEG